MWISRGKEVLVEMGRAGLIQTVKILGLALHRAVSNTDFLSCAVLMLGMENMDTKWLKDVLPYASDSRLSPANKSRQHSNSTL